MNKIQLYRKFSQKIKEACPPSDQVKEDVIIPRYVIREGELDSTIVHVTKDEDIRPRSA